MALIYPQLVGKRIQKVVEDEQGNLLIHTKDFVLHLKDASGFGGYGVDHRLETRVPTPETLVIPANK
jgi:hypothetical protein